MSRSKQLNPKGKSRDHSINNGPSGIIKSIEMIDENTMEIIFYDNLDLHSNEIDQVYRVLDDFSGNKPMKRLIVLGDKTKIDDEARLTLINENRKRKRSIIAEAIIAKGTAQKFFSLFYIMRLQNIYPSSLFNNVDEARIWLSARHN